MSQGPRALGAWVIYGILTVIAVVGLAYRTALATQHPVVRADGQIRYLPMARNLLAGRGFSTDIEPPYRPTQHEVPGYPLFLATLLRVSGNSLHSVVLVQLLLELATLALTALTARNLVPGRAAGLAAVALGLGCLFLPSAAVEFQATALAVFTTAALCFSLSRLSLKCHADSLRAWALAGLAGGTSAMVRVDTYLFLAAVFASWTVWTVVERRPWRPWLLQAGVFSAVFLLVLTPWIVRDWMLMGQVQLPGQGQFTYSHVGSGLKRWMDTWADDGAYVQSYVWGPFERRPSEFPAALVPDPVERRRAEALFAQAKTDAVDPFRSPVDRGFLVLADEARRKRPIETSLLVGLRRVLTTWVGVPSHTATPWGLRRPTMALLYSYWLLLAPLAALGVRPLWRSSPAGQLLLLALIGARSVVPFASAWGLAPIYLYQAIPAVLILAAQGISSTLAREQFRGSPR